MQVAEHSTERMHLERHHPLWLLIGFWVCVVISLGVVVRRLLELIHPSSSGPAPMAEINATFSSHAVLTAAHIIPAAIFVILSIIVLLRRTRSRPLEKLFFLFGVITGLTAYAMNLYAVGGWIEQSAVLVFDTWFLFALARAY